MATTMAQALAERIRYQASNGEKVLAEAGANSSAVFGDPKDVLTVCGNVADIAHTNHLWLLDAVAAGAVHGDLGDSLQRSRPTTIDDAVTFLGPRETDSCSMAISNLKQVNGKFADLVENLSDADLEAPVDMTFYGEKSLRDVLFIVIEHGSLHLGQSWGILKGLGTA